MYSEKSKPSQRLIIIFRQKSSTLPIKDTLSRLQVKTLENNCIKHGIDYFGIGHEHNGIVHVNRGLKMGITQPGITIVCGDSHTSTHGAFGCVAFGIGTTQVQQVFCRSIGDNVTPKDHGY